MRRVRPALIACIALLAAAGLTGCSLVNGDVGKAADIVKTDGAVRSAGDSLAKSLAALQGIRSATSSFSPSLADGRSVTLSVVSNAKPTTEQISAAVEDVRAAATGKDFPDTTVTVAISVPDGSSFTQSTYTMSGEQLAAEVDYWRRIIVASGTGIDETIAHDDQAVTYARTLAVPSTGTGGAKATVDRATIANFAASEEAIAAIPDTSKAVTTWILPGVKSQGTLPPTAVLALFGTVLKYAPAVDASATAQSGSETNPPTGVLLSWNSRDFVTPYSQISLLYYAKNPNSAALASHLKVAKTIVRIAKVKAPAGMNFSFAQIVKGQLVQSDIHFGDCAGRVSPQQPDKDFVATILAAGINLAPTNEGACVPKTVG